MEKREIAVEYVKPEIESYDAVMLEEQFAEAFIGSYCDNKA